MPKITNKADLVLGTNLILHIADKGGTDIAIGTSTITSSSTSFVASSTSGGITNRAIVIGDVLEVSHTNNNANEGITVTVTAVAANSITYTALTGTPATEAAGADINLVARRKTYQFLQAGGLSFVDGVVGGVLHSRIIDLWAANDLDRYPPVFSSIEPRAKSMANINGWEPHGTPTINAIRDMALEVRATTTSAARQIYALLRSTGNLRNATDQMRFWPASDPELTAPTAAVMQGFINQLVLILDTNLSIDRRGNWVVRCAEPGQTILYSVLNIQFAEIVTVSSNNEIDPKLANPGSGTPFTSDATIAAGGAYAGILYNLDVDGLHTGDVAGINYTFAGFVAANSQTNERVHEKINYLWRQPVNINNDGTGAVRRGDKQPPLTTFSGDVFTVRAFVTAFNAGQRNNLRLVDSSGVTRSFPLVNVLTITSAALGIGGTFTVYHADSHGTSAAVVLQNESAVDQRDITIAASVSIPFSYSTYVVDGHVAGTPLDIRVAFSRPGSIESGLTDSVTLDGTDKIVPLATVRDPSYVA